MGSQRTAYIVGCLLLLCSLFAAIQAGPAPTTSDLGCPYEPLPTSLDTYDYLGFNGEIHIHQEYYTKYNRGNTVDILFSVSTQSFFRMYVEPHYVDIDLWLYIAGTTTSLAHTSDFSLMDEVIFKTLEPGKYRIQFIFYSNFVGTCPTTRVELAIVPTARLTQRIASFNCPTSQIFPTIPNINNIGATGLHYDSGTDASLNAQYPIVQGQKYAFLQYWNLTLPTINTITDAWEIEAILGFHFPTSGLALLLQDSSLADPKTLACYDTDNCVVSTHNVRGQATLRSTLRPGNYSLWLYDVPQERNTTYNTCSPFTLSLDIDFAEEPEDFLNCYGEPIPTTLNEAGMLDDSGFIYFREDVLLDLAVRLTTIPFTVNQTSYFRAFTVKHRVDVDLILRNGSGNLASGVAYGGDEGIVYVISPGKYNLDFSIFGTYPNIFCETILFELAIAPVSLYNVSALCSSVTTSTPPDLSGLGAIQNNNFTLPYGVYTLNYTGNYGPRNISSQMFTLTNDSYISAWVGANFLIGDIRATLQSVANFSNPLLGYHRRNMHFMDYFAPAGTYVFNIVTGDTQATNIRNLPPCAIYSVGLVIVPEAASGPKQCLSNRLFPPTLMTPENLLTAPKIHMQEDFLVPKLGVSMSATQTVRWNVTTPSYFRLYTEPHHIDIDMILKENGNVVARKTGFNTEEALAYLLKANVSYSLDLNFYKWPWEDHGNDPCYTYGGELSITPATDRQFYNCTANNLPTNIPTLSASTPIDIDGDFYFNQTQMSETSIKFVVPSTGQALFRAAITYNFLWSDVALQLIPPAGDPVYGELRYNENEIFTMTLLPGNYTLRIYEPFNTTDAQLNLRSCVFFHLKLGVEVYLNNTDPENLMCKDQYFPHTLNSPSFLHNMTGNQVDFDRDILADVVDRQDEFAFIINVTSSFRLYIPVHHTLDIDVYLYRGNSVVTSKTSWGEEEEIMLSLIPAAYRVQFRYYGVVQIAVLPPPSACEAFRLQVQIYPVAVLASYPPIGTPCATNFNPTIIPGSVKSASTFTRSLESSSFNPPEATFTLLKAYLFTAELEQNDASSGIAMLLRSTTMDMTYNPLYFLNHIYLNEYLFPGSYSLSFHDPLGATTPVAYLCANYTLRYSLVIPTSIPDNYCPAFAIPTQLVTNAGGSVPFGGPQAKDGSIHLFGTNFRLYRDASLRHNYISFQVKSTSLVRLFLSVEQGNTLYADIYQTPDTTLPPLYTLIAQNGAARSDVWTLYTPGNYTLEIDFTTVSSQLTCNFFTFEFVLETVQNSQSELACISPLPSQTAQMPPETIYVYPNQDYSVDSDYIVTADRFNTGYRDGIFRYTMTITIESNSTLSATIGYDFLINDFSLTLMDTRGIVAVGVHQPSKQIDSSNVNFENNLNMVVAPGTYRLVISDIGQKNRTGMTSFCHYFSFSLYIDAPGGAAKVMQVNPSAGNNLDPNVPLQLTILFSEPVNISIPSAYSLQSWFAVNKTVYLYGANTNGPIVPIEAYFDPSRTQLNLVFTGFGDGWYLSLVVNLPLFTTRAGLPFANGALAFSHNYVMYHCSGCSGHGVCVGTQCVCSGNWTGTNCDRCALGTHAAGADCIANVACTNTTCNGHGRCNDGAGYPVCTCSLGYEGAVCDWCALGYAGYPNCTFNISGGEESESCTAPLLPIDLNGPAFLDYDGHLHMQGFYYINQVTRSHSMNFTLTQESLFRIYTEPHNVDIDIRLYQDVGYMKSIGYRVQWGLEEVLFMDLQPGTYQIQFQYYMWVTPPTNCETFNLELAIAPVTSAVTESANLNSLCGSSNILPSIPGTLVVSEEFNFHGDNFAVNAPNNSNPGILPNYFYRLNITINPPANMIASLHATVGYRFLQGDLSLLLERGSNGWHCNNTGNQINFTPPPGCTYGDNLQNENTLHRFVEGGDYVLWVYEPIRQNRSISSCSPFEFSLHIEFYEDTQDIFNCGMPLIPESLDNSEFVQTPGHIHFNDFFVLDGRAMNFTVATQSLMRAVVTGVESSVMLYNANTNAPVSTNGDSQNILANLAPGVYYLKFTTDMFQFCPVLSIEFALAPVNSPVNQQINCTRSPSSPNIQVTSLPFFFAPNSTSPYEPHFYSFNTPSTPIIVSIPFTVANEAFFDAGVESDFLRADLRLELYMYGGLIASGYHSYSYNHWQQVLERGSYELRIVLPPGQTVDGIPSCQRYNFNLRIVEIAPTFPMCFGEFLPYDFNTMRFLGYEGTMNYHSDFWRVPFFSSPGPYIHSINFTVPAQSLIRIFVEPHAMDIDIRLLFANDTSRTLATGSNAIGNEESLTLMLQPNTTYTFQLLFYNWAGGPVWCVAPFSIEVEIGPILNRTLTCPNGGQSYWPPIPSSLTLPFEYNSIDRNVSLYYQQVSRKSTTQSYSFTVSVPINIYAEVGFDFLVGDLLLKLYSSTVQQTWYGTNSLDRNTILLVNIPAGSYTLTIYEPSVNLDSVLACSDFTFAIVIEEFSSLVATDRSLIEYHFPDTLDSIPYLQASRATHLANNYFMFDGTGRHESTNFTIKENSMIRVEAMLAESQFSSGPREYPNITLFNSALSAVQTGNGSLFYTSLSPGTYTVRFYPPRSVTESGDLGVRLFIQLAIATIAEVTSWVQNNPNNTCADTTLEQVLVSPAGFYQQNVAVATLSSSTLSSKTTLLQLPFTLDRYSLVYIQIGSQFLIDELDVRVFASNGSLLLHGRLWKNINEIHEALPAGNYQLLVTQPYTQPTTLNHCGLFSYTFIIREADSTGFIDCSVLSTVPWQLNNRDGGSTPFGGPIASDGTLHFYGTDFHVPQQLASVMNFSVQANSLVSALAFGWPTVFTSIDFSLTNRSSAVTPRINSVATGDRSRLTQYSITNTDYSLTINYRGYFNYNCFSYGLQIDISPVSQLQSTLTCPTGVTAIPIPDTIDATIGKSSSVDSFMQGWNAVSGFSRTIRFSVTQINASVSFSLEYNSLVTAYAMKLQKSGVTNALANAQVRGQSGRAGKTNVYASIVYKLLPVGNYSLVISHPSSPAPLDNSQNLCFPFIFTYSVGSQVFVSDVSPPAVDNISPDSPLTITLTFSATPYTSSRVPISSGDSTFVAQSIYLQATSDSNNKISPISAVATSPAANRWVLTFPALPAGGLTFVLSLKPDSLFDNSNIPLFIPTTYRYNTIVCGAHGTFNGAICACGAGYAGSACTSCDSSNGYIQAKNSQDLLCVKDKCATLPPNYCCGDDSQMSQCQNSVPLGTCYTNSSNLAYCQCTGYYVGDRCGACAQGYYNWPACTNRQTCTPECVHGTCNNAKGVCDCPTNWDGAACEKCAKDYSGENCENYKVGGSDWTGTETFLKVVAVIVAIALIGGAAFWYWRRRLAGSRYKLVSRFHMEDDLDEEGGHRFPELDNQLVDDEGAHQIGDDDEHEHEHEHEHEANLPSPAGSVNNGNTEAFATGRLIDM